MDVIFPEFSSSKVASFKPDVVTIPTTANPPAYNLIIGVKSLAKIGAVLDFATYKLTIDGITLPMCHANGLQDLHRLHNVFREHLKPISTREATHRAIEILDANYEKADLPSIVDQQGKHLTTIQRNKLLRLLMKYGELFDGTLGDWQTKSVSFDLKPGAKPYHGRAFPIPHIHLATLKEEVKMLVELGVLKEPAQIRMGISNVYNSKKEKNSTFHF